MKCNCNDNGGAIERPKISHVYGNVLRIAIPLTLRSLIKDGDEMISTDTDFIPSSEYPVNVVFGRGKTRHAVSATMENNVAVIEDQGKIPIGTYDITVECRDSNGNPYRFKQNTVLQVVDTTAEAGIEETIEYEARTWYLNAAVFLATTEIGSVDDMIDQKLEYVFGFVEYDQSEKVFRFYNNNRTAILAEVDVSPFISDGMVTDVYIDTVHKTLVVVLNEDAGGRRFNVPLYLLFDDYYTKTQVDSRFSSVESQLSSRANINGSSREEFAATLFKLWGSEQSDGVAVIIDADVDHSPDSAFIVFIDEYNYGGRLIYVFPQDDETRHIATEEYVQEYVSEYGGGSFVQVQSDWNQTDTSAVDYIKNKPTIPVVPTNVSSFTNDAGYLTQHQSLKTVNGTSLLGSGDLDVHELVFGQLSNGSFYKLVPAHGMESGGRYTLSQTAETPDGKTLYIDVSTHKAYHYNNTYQEIGAVDLSGYVLASALATVATSGSYNDLINKPSIPAAQVQSDWNESDSSSKAYIANKPTIPTAYDDTALAGRVTTLENSKVTSVTVNGTNHTPTNGVVDLGTIQGGQGASGFTVNETSTALVLTVWDGATVNETSTSITIQQAS